MNLRNPNDKEQKQKEGKGVKERDPIEISINN